MYLQWYLIRKLGGIVKIWSNTIYSDFVAIHNFFPQLRHSCWVQTLKVMLVRHVQVEVESWARFNCTNNRKKQYCIYGSSLYAQRLWWVVCLSSVTVAMVAALERHLSEWILLREINEKSRLYPLNLVYWCLIWPSSTVRKSIYLILLYIFIMHS